MFETREAVIDALERLANALHDERLEGRIFVVGDTAMTLAYGRDDHAGDIEALFSPSDMVSEVAARLGSEHGWGETWLTDAVVGGAFRNESDATTLFARRGLTVQVASPRYLFAMKAVTARIERDAADLAALYPLCGFVDVEAAITHVRATAPAGLLPPKGEMLMRAVLGP
ncbi:MAG: nucleotidyltransferase [Actinobacteria bacterium]|nr:nucleotidyltransferase [Actinomycetota bacterium]